MSKICPSCGGSGRYVHPSGRSERCLNNECDFGTVPDESGGQIGGGPSGGARESISDFGSVVGLGFFVCMFLGGFYDLYFGLKFESIEWKLFLGGWVGLVILQLFYPALSKPLLILIILAGFGYLGALIAPYIL